MNRSNTHPGRGYSRPGKVAPQKIAEGCDTAPPGAVAGSGGGGIPLLGGGSIPPFDERVILLLGAAAAIHRTVARGTCLLAARPADLLLGVAEALEPTVLSWCPSCPGTSYSLRF